MRGLARILSFPTTLVGYVLSAFIQGLRHCASLFPIDLSFKLMYALHKNVIVVTKDGSRVYFIGLFVPLDKIGKAREI